MSVYRTTELGTNPKLRVSDAAYHHHSMYRWRSSLYCNCIKAIHHHHHHQLLKREFHINDVPIAVHIGSDYPTVDAPSARAINIQINY